MRAKDDVINGYNGDIYSAVASWGYNINDSSGIDKISQVKRWLGNFDINEIELAVELMKRINYYDEHKIIQIISTLSIYLKKKLGNKISNACYFPLGDSSASSGGLFLYKYCKRLGISSNAFPLDDLEKYIKSDRYLVFFDDIIGSGHQAVKFAEKHLVGKRDKCIFIALLGYQNGINYINDKEVYGTVIAGEVLLSTSKVFSKRSREFSDVLKVKIKNMCRKYGKKLYKYPLGYDNTQALIVFSHNTPNNTLPVIWASANNESIRSGTVWHPLWERFKEIENKESVVLRDAYYPRKEIISLVGNFQFDRNEITVDALGFIKLDFGKSKLSRRLNLIGKSGTGKTHLTKNILSNIDITDYVLYLDLNSDDFFINLFFELLIYNSMNKCYLKDGSRIDKEDSFIYFIENFSKVRDKNKLINSLYALLQQLPGVVSSQDTQEYFSENHISNDVSVYFFEYINYLISNKKVYLVIDNYQFLPDKIKEKLERNIATISHNLCFVTVIRLSDFDTETNIQSLCFSSISKTILLSELNIDDINDILKRVNSSYARYTADCLLKTRGNLKEIEYYIVQLRENISNKQNDNVRSLVENIKYLPDLERYLMTISSLFPSGMNKCIINQLMHIIMLVDDATFEKSINSLISIGYLLLNGISGNIVKPAHERIITSLTKSLGDESFLEIQQNLVQSLELLINNMPPGKEYSYLLHCFVGIFSAEQFKTKLSYVIKLLDIQYKANKYHYLVNFYKNARTRNNWLDVVIYFPITTLEQLLDSMQKTSEFYSGMELLTQLKQSGNPDLSQLMIYEVKFLTQTYSLERALERIESYEVNEQSILYKLNILQHLGKDEEAKRIVYEILNKQQNESHSEYFYIILRNTIHYFNMDRAVSNLKISQAYFAKKGLKFVVSTIKNNLGVVYLWGKELEVAEEYLTESENLLLELSSNEVFEPQCNLAVLYSIKGDLERALFYAYKALASFPKNLTFDFVMLSNNKQLIKLEKQQSSITDTYLFFKEQYDCVHKYMDPWLTYIIEYNLHNIELLITNTSSITPDNDRYQTVKENETGSLVFKSITINNKILYVVFALSPNWRY